MATFPALRLLAELRRIDPPKRSPGSWWSFVFPPTMLFGFCAGTCTPARKETMVVLAGVQAQSTEPTPGADSRIAAAISVYNEGDVLGETVRYLAGQGNEVYVIDNWSEDGTFELCQGPIENGLLCGLSRFREQKPGDYEWGKQLQHAAQYAAALEVDWILHNDADEIRSTRRRLASARSGVHTPRSTLASWSGQGGAALARNAVDRPVRRLRRRGGGAHFQRRNCRALPCSCPQEIWRTGQDEGE
jgi:hypothetical protein